MPGHPPRVAVPHCNLSVRIHRALWRRVRMAAVQADQPLREWVRDALEARLAAVRRRSG